MLRLSPGLSFGIHSETAIVSASKSGEPTGDRGQYPSEIFEINIIERITEFQFGIKLIYYIFPSLQLFVSYLPDFILDHLREENVNFQNTRPNRIRYAFLSNHLDDFNFWLSFQPSSFLSLNMQIFTDSDSGEFYINRFRLGLDFTFGE